MSCSSSGGQLPGPRQLSLDHVLRHRSLSPGSILSESHRHSLGTDLCILTVWKSRETWGRTDKRAQGQQTRTALDRRRPRGVRRAGLRRHEHRGDRGRGPASPRARSTTTSPARTTCSGRCTSRSSSRWRSGWPRCSWRPIRGMRSSTAACCGSRPTRTPPSDGSCCATPAPCSAGTWCGELDTRFGAVGLRGALRRAMTAGVMRAPSAAAPEPHPPRRARRGVPLRGRCRRRRRALARRSRGSSPSSCPGCGSPPDLGGGSPPPRRALAPFFASGAPAYREAMRAAR